MRVKVMIASGVVVVLVAGLVVALILRHGSRPVSAQAPASARAASSRRSVPPAAASAIRLLVSARGRSALTPELNTALSPGRLFPAGTMFTAMPGTWHQAGAYANVTGTLRVPGKPAANAEIGLVHRGHRWLVTFEEQK